MSKGRAKRAFRFVFYGSGLLGLAGFLWVRQGLSPTPEKPETYVRFENGVSMRAALRTLESKNLVRSELAYRVAAVFQKRPATVASGTYRLRGGMSPNEVYAALAKPIRQMVRMPETNWAKRSANLLERAKVTSAADYLAAASNPEEFQQDFPYPLPANGTLEGYLYPDTYDFPPLLGAKGVVRRQLANFAAKVKPYVKDESKLYRALIVASMVELEVAKDAERPIVAGVIENRLRKGMKLQIDAAINYGLQEWRELSYADLKNDGPYNTYTRTGLPPTPICSPSIKSIRAALNPAKHDFLYYVAMPEKYHLFSRTFDEHRKNIARRKAALKARGR